MSECRALRIRTLGPIRVACSVVLVVFVDVDVDVDVVSPQATQNPTHSTQSNGQKSLEKFDKTQTYQDHK